MIFKSAKSFPAYLRWQVSQSTLICGLIFIQYCLCHTEFHLDDETFRVLWNEYQSKGGIDYDEFVAVLTKLQILRGNDSQI